MKAILAWLLHHANRHSKLPEFYAIKDVILKKYGTCIGYDVQHIEGKKCYSCHGTGVHHKYDRHGFVYDADGCWHCTGGWYKRPQWIALARIQYGKYIFHRPTHRQDKPFSETKPTITGYISHSSSQYGYFAMMVLFLFMDRKSFVKQIKSYWSELGFGWRVCWWMPKNYLYNAVHIIKNGRRSIPFRKRKMSIVVIDKPSIDIHYLYENLPF